MTDNSRNTGPAPAQPAGQAEFIWLLFRFDGRIGREAYWLSILLLSCILFIILSITIAWIGLEATEGALVFFAIPSLWVQMAILIKRQHDRGLAWYWCALSFVPVFGLIWMIAMGVIPGNTGPNAYGERANTPPS